MTRKCKRINNGTIFGVCGGIAYYMQVQAWILRVLILLFTFAGGSGILMYILCALLMPKWDKDPEDYDSVCN